MVEVLDIHEILKNNPSVNAKELANSQVLFVEIHNIPIQKSPYRLVPPTERHRVRIDEKSCKNARTIFLRGHG